MVGYLLSYIAYHYIETRDADTDAHNKAAIGNIHENCFCSWFTAFVACYLMDKNSENSGLSDQEVQVQKMDTDHA